LSARIPPAGKRFRTCWQPAVRQDGEDRPGAAVAELTALDLQQTRAVHS
jgi:hypothetical protein